MNWMFLFISEEYIQKTIFYLFLMDVYLENAE